jgi:hypothetical protein
LFNVNENAKLTIHSCIFSSGTDDYSAYHTIMGVKTFIILADLAIQNIHLVEKAAFVFMDGGDLQIKRSIFRNITTEGESFIHSGTNTNLKIYDNEYTTFSKIGGTGGGIFDVTISSEYVLKAKRNRISKINLEEDEIDEIEDVVESSSSNSKPPMFLGGGVFNVKGYGNFMLDISDNYFECAGTKNGNGGVIFIHIFKDKAEGKDCYVILKEIKLVNNQWNRNYVVKENGKGENVYIESKEIGMELIIKPDIFKGSLNEKNDNKFWVWDKTNGYSKVSDYFPGGIFTGLLGNDETLCPIYDEGECDPCPVLDCVSTI